MSVANQVGSRFIGKLPEGKEALQCIFALTPEEKAEFTESLHSVDTAQLQQLFLQAVKQAALCPSRPPSPVSSPAASEVAHVQKSEIASQKPQILNKDAVCNGIVLAPNPQKPEIKIQKSPIPHGTAALCPPSPPRPLSPPAADENQTPKGLAANSQKLEASKSEIPSNDAVCNGIVLAPNPQRPEIKTQKSEILQDIFLQLDSAFPNLLSQVTGSSVDHQVTPSWQMLRFQKRKQEKKQRRMERFLDQLLRNKQ